MKQIALTIILLVALIKLLISQPTVQCGLLNIAKVFDSSSFCQYKDWGLMFEDELDNIDIVLADWKLPYQDQTRDFELKRSKQRFTNKHTKTHNDYFLSKNKSKKVLFTVEPYIFFPYYFVFSNPEIYNEKQFYLNSWNLGGGVLFSVAFAKSLIKLSAGKEYNTKNYYRGNSINNSIIDKIYCKNQVFQININPFRKYSPFIGLIFRRPFYYNKKNDIEFRRELRDALGLPKVEYGPLGNPSSWENIPSIYLEKRKAVRIGVNYRINEINRFNTNIIFFVDYTLSHEVIFYYTPISSGKFMIGFSLNLETYLNNNYRILK